MNELAAHPELDVVLVVTQPDRPAGRGRKLTPPPVKQAAEALGIPVYQPESLRTVDASAPLREAAPDLLVVVAYGEILRKHVLDLAPAGALNVHPSLLPRYRGSAPVRAAILNGDAETGVTIMRLVRKLDAGPIVRQERVPLAGNEDAESLSDELAKLAAEFLPETCVNWINGSLEAVEQDDALATMTREWSRDDARIDWTADAVDTERLVRASQPWPVAWTMLDGEPFRIHRSALATGSGLAAGTVRRQGKKIIVGCGSGVLELVSVQPAGKRAMPAPGWWNGVRQDEVQFDA